MKKMKKMRIFLGIFFVFSLMLLSSCSTEQSKQNSGNVKVYRIGSVVPLTGEGAVYGIPVQRVEQKAVADLNEKWASKNMKLEVVYEDGKCNGRDALTASQNLVNLQGVKIIIGGTCSSETLGMAPFTEENKVLLFSTLSSSPDVSNAGDFVFRNYPSDVAQVEAMVSFIKSKGYKNIAILSENTDYVQALRKGYNDQLPKQGVKIVADEVVSPNAKDVKTELSKIKSAKPDAVLLLPQTIPTGAVFAKQYFESGIKAQVLGNEVFGLPELVRENSQIVEGAYSPSAVFDKEKDPEFLEFTKQTDCQLGFYCATTYDGVFIIGELIEKCGENTECIKGQLYSLKDWQGKFSGSTTFDKNGDVKGQFQINQVVQGQIVKVS